MTDESNCYELEEDRLPPGIGCYMPKEKTADTPSVQKFVDGLDGKMKRAGRWLVKNRKEPIFVNGLWVVRSGIYDVESLSSWYYLKTKKHIETPVTHEGFGFSTLEEAVTFMIHVVIKQNLHDNWIWDKEFIGRLFC